MNPLDRERRNLERLRQQAEDAGGMDRAPRYLVNQIRGVNDHLLELDAAQAPFQPGQRVRLNDPTEEAHGQIVEVVGLVGNAPGVPRLYEVRAEGIDVSIMAEEHELEAL